MFAIAAGIIMIGFLGELVFKKTGLSSSVFLIIVGILLGPVFRLVSSGLLLILSPFTVLTLLMVFFYGGLDMKESLLNVSGRAVLLSILYVGLSITVITSLLAVVLRWPILEALLIGTIVGGQTSTAVVAPLVKTIKIGNVAASVLTFESIINSIIGVTLFLVLLGAYGGIGHTAGGFVGSVVSGVTSGVVLGGLAGGAALLLFRRLGDQTYTYILTIGLVLLTYVISGALAGANGYIAVFVFGFVIANYTLLNNVQKVQLLLDDTINGLKQFQKEITFLLNTLFFVFLGVMFRPEGLSYLPLAALITAVLIATRAAAVWLATAESGELVPYRGLMTMISSQGVVQAVLAILVLNTGAPFSVEFIDLVVYVIIITNLITTAASLITSQKKTLFKDFMTRVADEPTPQ